MPCSEEEAYTWRSGVTSSTVVSVRQGIWSASASRTKLGFAAAYDLAVLGVGGDGLSLLLARHVVKALEGGAYRVELLIDLRLLDGNQARHGAARERQGAGDARRLDAHEVHRVGVVLLVAFELEVENVAVLVNALPANAREVADEELAAHLLEHLGAVANQSIQVVLGALVVLPLLGDVGVGAHEDVAVDSGGGMRGEAAAVVRRRVDRRLEERAGLLVEHEVLALEAAHRVVGITEHLGDIAREGAGTVDDPLGAERARRRVNQVAVVGDVALNGRDLAVEEEFHTVLRCVVGERDGVGHGIQDAGGRHVHGKLTARVRLDELDLLLIDHAHALDAVLLSYGLELEDVLAVVVGEAHHEFAGALEGNAQLGGDLVEFLVALHSAFRLERAGLVGKARVQHAGVAAAVSAGDVELLFKHGDAQAITRQLACHGRAHDARADDDYVPLLHTNPS